jgi:hypothetical protein
MVCGTFLLVILTPLVALADSLYGTVRFKDGSKDRGTTKIVTSWKYGQHAKLDGSGNYTLDYGQKVGTKVTVYVNGSKYKEITITGATRLDIVVP